VRRAPLGTPKALATLPLVVAALLVSGCAGQGAAQGPGAAPDRAGASSSPAGPTQAESLPPGDPGLDAPSVPDPGTDSADHGQGEARRKVPPSAMLTAETVGMAVGGSWQRHGDSGDECVIPEGAVGLTTVSYGGSGESRVVETVATYPDDESADAAVARIGEMASECGWKRGPDPRLGSASVAAKDPSRSLVAVSAEGGVMVLLIASGPVARDNAGWGSVVDLAVGTSCAAAPDGCH
jgi:hypothetical protein